MSKKNLFKLVGDIKKKADAGVEDYGTGLVGEGIIVASYETMPLNKLEKMRYIINKIIKKKKEMKRVHERVHAEQNAKVSDADK